MAVSEQQATQQALQAGADPTNLAWARRQLDSWAYIELCEKFVEQATYGRSGIYGSAIAASDALQGSTDWGSMQPGDTIYFSPNGGGAGQYGHTGIYSGGDNFISATPQGVREMPILEWMRYSGQTPIEFIPQGGRQTLGFSDILRNAPGLGGTDVYDPNKVDYPWDTDLTGATPVDTGGGNSDLLAFLRGIPGIEGAGNAIWDRFNPQSTQNTTQPPSPYGQSGGQLGQGVRSPETDRYVQVSDNWRLHMNLATGYQQWETLDHEEWVPSGQPSRIPAGSAADTVGQGNLEQRIAEFKYKQGQDLEAKLRQAGRDKEADAQAALNWEWKQKTFDYQQQQDTLANQQNMANTAMGYAKWGTERQALERANRALFSTRGQPAAPETQLPAFTSFYESLGNNPYNSPNFLAHLQALGSSPQSPDFLNQWNAWRNQNMAGLQPSIAPMENTPWFQGMRGGNLAPWRPPPGVGMPDLANLSKFSSGEMGDYSKFLTNAGTSIEDIFNAIKGRMPKRAAPTPSW